MLKRSTYIVVLLCNVMFFAGALALGLLLGYKSASAACSPGIPCTDYDLYTDWNAGHDPALNALKSGKTSNFSESTCDGNFMNQIYSKAYMEGQRQVIMSEQIIHKPDSVLEYTCFDGYISLAATVEKEFSYTDRWKDDYEQDRETADETITDTFDVYREYFNDDDTNCPPGGDPELCVNNLSEALSYIVRDTLNSYLSSNFSHTYLGEATTIDASRGSIASCSDMATVWSIAKCLDFGEDDRFRTFRDLVNADPRSIPKECSPGFSFTDDIEAGVNSTKLDTTGPSSASASISPQCPPEAIPEFTPSVNTDLSDNMIRVANNCSSPAGSGEHAYSMMDLIELRDYLILGAGTNSRRYIPGTGGSASGTTTCAPPIPTGIPVITYEHDMSMMAFFAIPEFPQSAQREKFIHYEYICPNPGCFYRPNKVQISETAALPRSTPIGSCVPY